MLVSRAIEAARVLGAARVLLETDPALMTKAIRLYRGIGFRETRPYSTLAQLVPTLLTMEKRVA
jgi:ribosomal protein S18 acetylase RimI-like enzyme